MSYNSNESAMAMEAKLMRMDRLYKEMAIIMTENPYCLDGNPRKEEVLQMLFWQLGNKLERSKTEGAKRPNSASVISLEVLVDCFEEDGTRENARKVVKLLFELSVEELKCAPEELKERAITITEYYFVNY